LTQTLIEEVKRVGPWFHQIELTEAVRTRDVAPSPGPQPKDHPLPRWEQLRDEIPADLSGMRVLDVGCADGFFSIEMARRGAAEVVAVDPWAKAVARVAFVRDHFGLGAIAPRQGDVYGLDESYGRFDFILALALLYHLEHPLLGLQRMFPLSDVLYLESITVDDDDHSYLYLRHPDESGSHFVPKWLPTRRCLRDMLTWVGYASIEELPASSYSGRSAYKARR
jgi:tRNA (mo5U34)-methyltransferase